MGIWTEKELYGIIGTGFFLHPAGFFFDLFPGYRVSNSTVWLGMFFFQICFRGVGFQLALFPGYKVSNSTVWLGRFFWMGTVFFGAVSGVQGLNCLVGHLCRVAF